MLHVIKAAQRLGFTLEEVGELVSATGFHGHRRTDGGLRKRAAANLDEIDAKLAELTDVRNTLRTALDAGCDDLLACAETPYCPTPFPAAR